MRTRGASLRQELFLSLSRKSSSQDTSHTHVHAHHHHNSRGQVPQSFVTRLGLRFIWQCKQMTLGCEWSPSGGWQGAATV